MDWINSGRFQIADRNGRHYVYRRNNRGNTEINIPASVVTIAQAKRWLKNNPNKVQNPTRFKPKKVPIPLMNTAFFMDPHGAFKQNSTFLLPIAESPLSSPPYEIPNSPNLNLNVVAFKKSLTTIKPIGVGQQGKAFLAHQKAKGKGGYKEPVVIKVMPYDNSAAKRKEMQPGDFEFENQRVCMNLAPDGVVRVLKHYHALDFVKPSNLSNIKNIQNTKGQYNPSKQNIIVMEYCSNGSLRNWLEGTVTFERKFSQVRINDNLFKKIIGQVLGTLSKIRKKYPHFNHNDLHIDNIFVSPERGYLIGDFGWSRLKEMGTNPAVNTANGTRTAAIYGIGPKTDPRFDSHFFLNELREWLKRHDLTARCVQTAAFLDRAVPPGYRGNSDLHVSEWRLKYGDPCPGLPTLASLIKDPYVKGGISVANLAAAKARLRKVKVPSPKKLESIVLRPKRKVTSPMLAAAKARLRKTGPSNKKTYTNQELINMSAANFLKLSPKTRNRAKVLRAAAKKKSPPGNKGKGKGKAANATKSVATYSNLKLNKSGVKVPPAILKTAKFNKLVEKIHASQGGAANESFQNAWNRARTKAINQVANRLKRNLAPFSPSPAKSHLPPPLSPLSPPKPKAKPKAAPKGNVMKSPKSGRVKVKGASGRWVYANLKSLDELRLLAAIYGVNIASAKTKANIIQRIFSAKNK
jgi:serine/threonine protein kinase